MRSEGCSSHGCGRDRGDDYDDGVGSGGSTAEADPLLE